jgi:FKBP-type peptidyl-prolyl cis-trans isomerase
MGVQVESIQAGDGKHYPMKRQTVTLHYVGYLDREGQKKFDSTWDRGAFLPQPHHACIRAKTVSLESRAPTICCTSCPHD